MSKSTTRFLKTVAALCAAAIEASAQASYCAQRIDTGLTGSACFSTLAQAEAYLRVEPPQERGNKYLEPVDVALYAPIGLNYINLRYAVRNRPWQVARGSWYSSWGSLSTYICARIPIDGVVGYGCSSESSLAWSMTSGLHYGGLSAGWSGVYGPEVPTRWYAMPLSPLFKVLSDPLFTTRRIEFYGPMGRWGSEPVTREQWFECPPPFRAREPDSVPSPFWPYVCGVQSEGSIRVYSRQFPTPCKDDSCGALSGNKQYREVDFEWEGRPFQRVYNSISDFPLKSGMGNNWAHSYSDRLIMRSNLSSDMVWLRGDGHMETFSETATDRYASQYEPGATLYKQDDGRWRVSTQDGRSKWFGDDGRLKQLFDGHNTLRLEYCDRRGIAELKCPESALVRVASDSGRALDFEYGPVNLELTRIRLGGAQAVEYAYDAAGRLVSVRYGETSEEGRRYTYGEAGSVCRDGAGAELAGCDPGFFQSLLTGLVDETGARFASFRYDAFSRLTASEQAGGAGRIALSYSPDDTRVTIAEPDGSGRSYVTRGSWVHRDVLTVQYTDSDGGSLASAQGTYAGGRPSSWTDALGRRTDERYDGLGLSHRVEGLDGAGALRPESRETRLEWHPTLNVLTGRTLLGADGGMAARSTWTHNGRGQVLTASEVDPGGGAARTVTHRYCDDPADAGACPLPGLLASIDGPRTDVSDVTTLEYYADATADHAVGDLHRTRNALGHTVQYTKYDRYGRALELVGPDGTVTSRAFDARQRVVRSTTAGRTTTYEYEPTGLLKSTVAPNGRAVAYEYDAAQRLTAVTDAAGRRAEYTLDVAGHRTVELAKTAGGATQRQVRRTLDARGRLRRLEGLR